MTTINIRIDEKLKKEAQKTFEDLGMDMSTAVKMFFKQTVSDQALPFQPARKSLTRSQISKVATRWNKEVDEAVRTGKRYDDTEAFVRDLGI